MSLSRTRMASMAGASTIAAGALVLAALVVLIGSAQAAAPQQVAASLTCQPGTVAPTTTTGCTLTVTNIGGNNVNNVTITNTASGGATFLASDNPLCTTSANKLVLTCTIGKLAAGAKFEETHELQAPGTGASVGQMLQGRYSSATGNNRGSDSIMILTTNPLPTTLNASPDFDGKFANEATDSVQTDPISAGNPYSTGATLGTTGFEVGLTVEEKAEGSNNVNCPSTGCFGGQVIDFNITPLDGVTYPVSFQLTIKVYVGPGVKESDIDIRHTTTLGTILVPMCANPPDPSGECVVSKPIDPATKIATITIVGPGARNGGWGVG
jgi:hypothetical protein